MQTRDQLHQQKINEGFKIIIIPKITMECKKKKLVQIIKNKFQKTQHSQNLLNLLNQDIATPQLQRKNSGCYQEKLNIQKAKKIIGRYTPFLTSKFMAYQKQSDQELAQIIIDSIDQIKNSKISKQKRIEWQDFIKIFNNSEFTSCLKEFLNNPFLHNKLKIQKKNIGKTKIKQDNIVFYEIITQTLKEIMKDKEKISNQTLKQLQSTIQEFFSSNQTNEEENISKQQQSFSEIQPDYNSYSSNNSQENFLEDSPLQFNRISYVYE